MMNESSLIEQLGLFMSIVNYLSYRELKSGDNNVFGLKVLVWLIPIIIVMFTKIS